MDTDEHEDSDVQTQARITAADRHSGGYRTMASLCWKLSMALVLVLSITQCSQMPSAAVISGKDADARLAAAGHGVDHAARTDSRPSINCNHQSVSDNDA